MDLVKWPNLPWLSYSSVVEHPKYSLEGHTFDSHSKYRGAFSLCMPMPFTEWKSPFKTNIVYSKEFLLASLISEKLKS